MSPQHAHPPARVAPHRDTFDERLRSALAQARREGSGLAVVVVHAPPCCLDALATMVRDSDVAAPRNNGCFAVLIMAPTVADVRRAGAIVADRLESRVRAFAAHGDPFPHAAVTVAGAGDDEPQALLERAGLTEAGALS
jgi:hypothetical protein